MNVPKQEYATVRPSVRDLAKQTPARPAPPKATKAKPAKPAPAPAPSSGLLSMLVLLLCLVFGSIAQAQYTTNAPSVRTNVSLSFTSNSPLAASVGYTNWPPAPTFGAFDLHLTNTVQSIYLTNVSWTAATNPATGAGVIQVWQATNSTSWVMLQEFARTNSVTNTALYCTGQTYYGNVVVKTRFRQGPWVSAFSSEVTNTLVFVEP